MLTASMRFSSYDDPCFEVDEKWEIPRTSIVMGMMLGEGAFGSVFQAEAIHMGSDPNLKTLQVAVKVLKEKATHHDRVGGKEREGGGGETVTKRESWRKIERGRARVEI